MDVSNQSNGRLQNSSFEHPVNGLDNMYTVRDVEIIQTSDVHEAKDSDGMKGEKPSPLGHSGDEENGSCRFTEEKQRSMEALVNGKFKALISQLLRSAGVASYEEGVYLAVLKLTLQVLLKTAQSDALKVKFVVQCAVFLVYHLILETAFFVDQRATLSYADVATDLPTDTETLTLGSINSRVPHNTDTRCSDSSTLEFKGNSTFDVPHNPALLCGFSSIFVALRKVMGKDYRTLWFHNVERLSELPFNIIHHMLSRLTLKDIACIALFQRHVMSG
ncbi:hypothetical protein ACFXTN_002726 [Malus domestica]